MRKTLFALSSWSNAGTPWVTQCLNLHPQVRAWIGGMQEFGGERELTLIEWTDAIVCAGWPDHTIAGEVHMIRSDQFRELEEHYGETFRGGHLVAHPVTRLAGSLAISREMGRRWDHDFFTGHWGVPRGSELSDRVLAILGEKGDHVPAHYMMNINQMETILRPPDAAAWPWFKLEELMREDAVWDEMVRHFSRGEITDYGAAWRALEGTTVGVAHEPFTLAGGPRFVWNTFPDHVRAVFAELLTDEARRAYERVGYDLSFVPSSRRSG